MKTIIVIEDQPSILDNVLDILDFGGYQAYGASGGGIGLSLIEEHKPDLVICDVMMDDVGGYEVLKNLRENPETSTIPFIFLTAMAGRHDLRHGMEMGADDYITKPFTPDELLAAIEARLNKYEHIEEKHQTTLHTLKKNISYALPHELRTPLMSILGYAQLLNQPGDTPLMPDQIDLWSANILKAGHRLERVIENYLVYIQLETVTDSGQIDAFRNHLIRNTAPVIIEQAKLVAARYDRVDDLDIDLESLAMRISGEDLGKIIWELVDNACKFSAKGTAIQLKAQRQENKYFIVIQDAGRGISPEQISQMGAYMQFERNFYEQQGLGLGFTVAKRLTEFHGGQLHIESQPNVGTRITLAFELYSTT